MKEALAALERLREGNARFVAEQRSCEAFPSSRRRLELVAGQRPSAIILGCSDSRAPAELVFDQGLGDLFVIRVAGNVVAPSQIGSVEFAAEHFGTELVVVMGHTNCGAIEATYEQLTRPTGGVSPYLQAIVERITPALGPLLETELKNDRAALLRHALRANVRIAADHLRHGSAIVEERIRKHGLLVVGAEYCLESGKVEFFDGVPTA